MARRGEEVALRRRSCSVRAEHLLLAAVEHPTESLAAVLERFGLDADDVADALDLERVSSLAAVGISPDDYHLAGRAPTFTDARWDASARQTLKRALGIAAQRRDRDVSADHVVLGALQADRGTVARAVAKLAVDRADLRAALDSGLDARR